MSKRQKLLDRLCKKPTPTDFKWEDLVTLMKYYDFEVSCGGGSHYSFEHKDGYCFKIPRSHPDGILKIYQIKEVLKALTKIEVIPWQN